MQFWKYQGLGNDFILLDHLCDEALPGTESVIAWCERRRGVGADGVIAVLPSRRGVARMVVINADGSRARMCGNGLRCVARWLSDRRLVRESTFVIETDSGERLCTLQPDSVAVGMGRPDLSPAALPMSRGEPLIAGPIEVEGERFIATAISMGNPHLVLFDVDPARATTLGPVLERHPLFPERVNVGFARVTPDGIALTVWERGAGLTLACGTGACAAAVAATLEGRLGPERPVPIHLPGGTLDIRLTEGMGAVTLRGPAVQVFEGNL